MGFALNQDPIAIIGMACAVPGAEDLDAFWRLVTTVRPAFAPLASPRWDWERYGSPRGAALPEIELDWRKYKVPPRELILVHRMEAYLVAVNKLHGAEIGPASPAFVAQRTVDLP